MFLPEYDDADATRMAEWVESGDVSPPELLRAAIERVEKRNPSINAVVQTLFEQARADTQRPTLGPLGGVPFLLKDLADHYAGVPTTSGSRLLADYIRPVDSEIVQRYKRAGLVILGKTSTPEFGLLGVTEPELFGACRNPWDTSRTPGGSSGGSAAAVAARMVPAASGGDGGGSIRIPASCCGLVGLKPTRARTPLGPGVTEAWCGLVVQHVLTRTVRDSALFLDVTQGPELGAPCSAPAPATAFSSVVNTPPRPLRIAVFHGSLLGTKIEPECTSVVLDTARMLEKLGHHVEPACPAFDRFEVAMTYLSIVSANLAADVAEAERLADKDASEIEAASAFLRRVGVNASAATLIERLRKMARLTYDWSEFFLRYDVFLCATLAAPPVRIGELSPSRGERAAMAMLKHLPSRAITDKILEQLATRQFEAIPNTQIFNMTGHPAISLPVGQTPTGLPLGVQLAAPHGDEATLLQVGRQLEQELRWHERRPPDVAKSI